MKLKRIIEIYYQLILLFNLNLLSIYGLGLNPGRD